MANFEPKDRIAIENYLQMGGGYVLNFNNRTFSNFISDSTGKYIDDEVSEESSSSEEEQVEKKPARKRKIK